MTHQLVPLKIMDEKLTVSYSELTGCTTYIVGPADESSHSGRKAHCIIQLPSPCNLLWWKCL